MPTPNPTTRREFKGAAAATTLQNSMTNADTSFVLVAANNWPTGAVGKFVVTVNRGQADEEKILCDTQSSRTVSCLLANRGFDGTTAQGHSAGATVECTISAFDADEWNQHTNATTAVHGVAGAVVGTTDTQILTNKTLNGATLDAASTLGGVSGTALSGAWTAFTIQPHSFGSDLVWPGSGGSIRARYKQVGKTVHAEYYVRFGTGATFGTGGMYFAPAGLLPVAPLDDGQFYQFWYGSSSGPGAPFLVQNSQTANAGTFFNGNSPATTGAIPSGYVWYGRFTYEAA